MKHLSQVAVLFEKPYTTHDEFSNNIATLKRYFHISFVKCEVRYSLETSLQHVVFRKHSWKVISFQWLLKLEGHSGLQPNRTDKQKQQTRTPREIPFPLKTRLSSPSPSFSSVTAIKTIFLLSVKICPTVWNKKKYPAVHKRLANKDYVSP